MKNCTVQELIEALEKVKNKDLTVSMEGCDCYQPATTLIEEPYSSGSSVLIRNVESLEREEQRNKED